MRVRNICIVIIVGLVVVVGLLSHKVLYLKQQYEQTQNEIKHLKENREDEIVMMQISDGDERHSIESELWNAQAELRRCHARLKTKSH